jgi:hypothetical protein
MSNFQDLRDVALRLPGVEEGLHRGDPAFRAAGKTFALWWSEEARTIMKLSAPHQQLLFEVRPEIFQPCRVGVGTWSFVDLSLVEDKELEQLVIEAWSTVVPKRVSKAFGRSSASSEGGRLTLPAPPPE